MKHKRFYMICILALLLSVNMVLTVSAFPFSQTETLVSEEVTPEAEEEITLISQDTEEIEKAEEAVESEENREEETADPVEPPEAPVPENPSGDFSSKAMGFYWKPSENAEHYEVYWQNDRGYEDVLLLEADDWTCQLDRCIVYTELPSDGSYTWKVTAVNEGGSAESEEMTFTIPSIMPAPQAYRPDAALSNQKALIFEWEDVGYNASAYRIQVADVTTDRVCMDAWYSTEAMNHVAGVCYLETEEYLPSGSYVWRVQGSNGSTTSNWSEWRAFNVTCAECELGTYLNSTTGTVFPKGLTVNAEPQFAWRTVMGAVSYQLEVKDSKGTILLDESVPSANCSIELCTCSPTLELQDGETYTWTVTTYGWNNSFWGTDDGAFGYVVPKTLETKITFIGSEGLSLDPDNQQIVWTDPGREVAAFRFGIRDMSEEWLFVGDLTRDEAWCDGITCSVQFQTIPEGENYEVVLIPYSEYNLPGDMVSMTFSNIPEPETSNE